MRNNEEMTTDKKIVQPRMNAGEEKVEAEVTKEEVTTQRQTSEVDEAEESEGTPEDKQEEGSGIGGETGATHNPHRRHLDHPQENPHLEKARCIELTRNVEEIQNETLNQLSRLKIKYE